MSCLSPTQHAHDIPPWPTHQDIHNLCKTEPNNGTKIWCFKPLAFKNSIEHLWGSLMMFRSCFLGNVDSKIKHISQEKLAGISYATHTNMQIIQPFSKEMIAVDPEQ